MIFKNNLGFVLSVKINAQFKAKDLISPYSAPINVYPQNNIGEVLNTMKKLNLESKII